MTILVPSSQLTEDGPVPLCALAPPRELSLSCDDAWHRLVKVKSGATLIATFDYDGQNWRITKTTAGPTTRHYYYTSSWQVAEERLGTSGTSEVQYWWGPLGVDNLICRDRYPHSERLFPCTNPTGSVTSVIYWTTGAVLERYNYHAYGAPVFMTAAWGSRASSSYDWDVLFDAYRRDADTGLYAVRNRYLHPTLGRWLTRDPVGYTGGLNLYAYVGNNPINMVDPWGLANMMPEGYKDQHWRPSNTINNGFQSIHYDYNVDFCLNCCALVFSIDVNVVGGPIPNNLQSDIQEAFNKNKIRLVPYDKGCGSCPAIDVSFEIRLHPDNANITDPNETVVIDNRSGQSNQFVWHTGTGASWKWNPKVGAHEIGHAFGLFDEYVNQDQFPGMTQADLPPNYSISIMHSDYDPKDSFIKRHYQQIVNQAKIDEKLGCDFKMQQYSPGLFGLGAGWD